MNTFFIILFFAGGMIIAGFAIHFFMDWLEG